jgi:hypothetical protein
VKCDRCVALTTLPLFVSRLSRQCRSSTCHKRIGLQFLKNNLKTPYIPRDLPCGECDCHCKLLVGSSRSAFAASLSVSLPEEGAAYKPLRHCVDVANNLEEHYRLSGLVVRVPGYRSRDPGPIPGVIRSPEKHWVWNGVHSAS